MKSSKKTADVSYVVASRLGSIGMGSTAYNAIKGVDSLKNISYNVFCRGYDKKLGLNSVNIKSYGFLETISLPLRAMEKILGLKINPFKYINYFFGKLVYKNLPDCKIYHSWMDIAPEAALKAKANGATLILEGANSHPLNTCKILNNEYKKLGMGNCSINPNTCGKNIELINNFDYVMCPSDFVYNSFLEQGFSEKRLIRMPYGVELNKFRVNKTTSDKLRFVFVGSVQIRKGIHYLLKAWNDLKLKNAELVIVGRIWPDAKKIAEKYKKNKTINFVGFDPNPKKYLESSDVFISPSLEEGSALTCYEAMACGLPLIATFNTGSVARNGKDGFIITAGDSNILKEKIRYFYENRTDVEKMGLNARKRVEKFSWGHYSKRIAKFYERVLNEKKK